MRTGAVFVELSGCDSQVLAPGLDHSQGFVDCVDADLTASVGVEAFLILTDFALGAGDAIVSSQ